MILLKFGGSSVASAERILAAGEIVRERLDRRPVVVVSALGGVTDLLEEALDAAVTNDREALDRLIAQMQRVHRWALDGVIHDASARHQVSLEVDGLFEELRQRLRSIRFLGEGSAKASDAVLAVGEDLSARIVAAGFRALGLPATRIDPRQVLLTDSRHGEARPDLDAVQGKAREKILPILDAGDLPVVGGFVGAAAGGETTTLGRGGSDTSAAVLGAALEAEEIQIWTDVDGLMSADPRLVPGARTLPRVSFAEASELAIYGARVLHPDCIGPAVRRGIPVHVLNSLRPEAAGTVIVEEHDEAAAPLLASVASRGAVCTLRVSRPRTRSDATFLTDVLEPLRGLGLSPDLVVATEVGVNMVLPRDIEAAKVERVLSGLGARVELREDRAVICVVGSGLARDPAFRARVLAELAGVDPEMVALGASATGLAAVFPVSRLESAVRALHRRFFEQGVSA